MSEHVISLSWKLNTSSFDYEQYNRTHAINFDSTNHICASAAPDYHGDASCVNPEQAFVASIASCHMLTFLAIASKRKFTVIEYKDTASGILGKNKDNQIAITQVTLKPMVTFRKEHAPDIGMFNRIQQQAHRGCFIANSIASCIKINIDADLRMN